KAASVADLLCHAASERRRAVPRLCASDPDVPAALEVVVRRCLAPAPGDRYASAGELAADLQAVADDQPLVFSSGPWPGRAARWLRGRRRPLAMVSLAALALAIAALALHQQQVDRVRRRGDYMALFEQATASKEKEDFTSAKKLFESAATLVDGHV